MNLACKMLKNPGKESRSEVITGRILDHSFFILYFFYSYNHNLSSATVMSLVCAERSIGGGNNAKNACGRFISTTEIKNLNDSVSAQTFHGHTCPIYMN